MLPNGPTQGAVPGHISDNLHYSLLKERWLRPHDRANPRWCLLTHMWRPGRTSAASLLSTIPTRCDPFTSTPCRCLQVAAGGTLEVTLSQFWSSVGDSALEAELEFHGLCAEPGTVALDGSAGAAQAVKPITSVSCTGQSSVITVLHRALSAC